MKHIKPIAAAAVLSIVFSIASEADAGWNPLKQVRDAAKRAEKSVRTEAGRASDAVKRAHRLNYRVIIQNRTNGNVYYNFEGRPEFVFSLKGWRHTGSKLGKPVISFGNGRGQTVRYTLSNGTYYFKWKSGVLHLYRK